MLINVIPLTGQGDICRLRSSLPANEPGWSLSRFYRPPGEEAELARVLPYTPLPRQELDCRYVLIIQKCPVFFFFNEITPCDQRVKYILHRRKANRACSGDRSRDKRPLSCPVWGQSKFISLPAGFWGWWRCLPGVWDVCWGGRERDALPYWAEDDADCQRRWAENHSDVINRTEYLHAFHSTLIIDISHYQCNTI